jgi:hypothetical protein
MLRMYNLCGATTTLLGSNYDERKTTTCRSTNQPEADK